MSRSSAQKRIHYVRAVFPDDTTAPTLERSLRRALTRMHQMADTEVEIAGRGTFAIRQRNISPNFVRLAIGGGVPREAMSTLGLGVAAEHDRNVPEPPPEHRAFKQSDAFCLIDDNEVLVCADGSIRVGVVNAYLRQLLRAANATPDAQNFELRSRIDRDALKTIEAEGIKEIRIKSAAYAVGSDMESNASTRLFKGFRSMVKNVRELFEEIPETDAERDAVVDHWSQVSVSSVISVKGATRGEPIVVSTLEEIAKDVLGDTPAGAEVTLMTRRGNPIAASSLTLATSVVIRRIDGQNDFDASDAWDKLADYRMELRQTARWKQ